MANGISSQSENPEGKTSCLGVHEIIPGESSIFSIHLIPRSNAINEIFVEYLWGRDEKEQPLRAVHLPIIPLNILNGNTAFLHAVLNPQKGLFNIIIPRFFGPIVMVCTIISPISQVCQGKIIINVGTLLDITIFQKNPGPEITFFDQI